MTDVWVRFWMRIRTPHGEDTYKLYPEDIVNDEKVMRAEAEDWANIYGSGCERYHYGYETKDPPKEWFEEKIHGLRSTIESSKIDIEFYNEHMKKLYENKEI